MSNFDENKIRRAGDGKFTTKGFSEAADGVNADLGGESLELEREAMSAIEEFGFTLTDDTPEGRTAFMRALVEEPSLESALHMHAQLDPYYGQSHEHYHRAGKALRHVQSELHERNLA